MKENKHPLLSQQPCGGLKEVGVECQVGACSSSLASVSEHRYWKDIGKPGGLETSAVFLWLWCDDDNGGVDPTKDTASKLGTARKESLDSKLPRDGCSALSEATKEEAWVFFRLC